MCGIIGIASCSRNHAHNWLMAGRDAMAHRGPDNAGIWWSEDGRVGLGHRRLAIIDISPAGHQPMQDITGKFIIVFNGEIYNFLELKEELTAKGHTFYSHSDTEVILASYREWGTDCLPRLNGMFAFAIYDHVRQRLFLARDRAGEKPLFYSLTEGELRFSSELKGLLANSGASRRIDAEALDLYLSIGYVPGERCIVEGVNKLPPAHAMLFDLKIATTRVWRYWKLPEPPRLSTTSSLDEQGLLNELESLLEESVRRQLEADVPVGVLLSGGVDSSLITAMAARASRQVKTFTVSFPIFRKYNESEHARLISEHFGTEHSELYLDDVTPDLLNVLARQYDEPIIDSSMIPTYLVCKLVREHCKVVLGGDGGDELFGGYDHYTLFLWIKENFKLMPQSLKRAIANIARVFLPLGFKGRNLLQSLSCNLLLTLPLIPLFDGTVRQQLMGGVSYTPWSLVAENIQNARIPLTDDLLQRVSRMDFENYMVEDILVKIDRASMLNSLEMRAPLLDYQIIEFAFGRVPSHLKTTTNKRKILLKQLAAKLLPSSFNLQRKKGFGIPLAEWLKRGPWRKCLHEILLDDQCMFDKKTVMGLIRGHDCGMNNQERLFGLALFELWRSEYKMSL